MGYEVLGLVLGCGALALLIALLIVPFIALHRTKRIGEIVERLRSLEREVAHLRRDRATASTPETSVPEIAIEAAVASAPTARADAGERPKSPSKRREPRPAAAPEWSALDWETWLGARGLGWAAVVLLLFAAAFFFREIFELNLIGPVGRIGIGVALGCAACAAGYWQDRKGWLNTGQMLTAAGVVLLYLSTFASFGYYRLLDSNDAGIFLVLIVAEAFALAIAYNAPGIAIMAVVGGLLNPILLRSDTDRYVSFFTYLAVLNAGVVGLLLIRRWRALALLVILGTNALFWAWYAENYHPTKLTAALVFHLVLAALWLGQQLFGVVARHALFGWEEAVRVFVQSLSFASAGYILLDERIPEWMGTIAVGVAILHTAIMWLLLRRRPADTLHAMCEWSLAMGFLAAVVFVQASAPWVAVGWAAQGLALWWFSGKVRSLPLRLMGFAFLGLSVARFIFVQRLKEGAHSETFLPLLNTFALSGLAIAGCLIAAAIFARRLRSDVHAPEFVLSRVVGLAGLFLVWVVVSVDAYDYFQMQRNLGDRAVQASLQRADVERNREDYDAFVQRRDDRLARSSQVALSIVWGLYASALLTLGLKLPSRPLRWCALGLFGITLLKVILFDMENLPGLYRVGAFFGLSLMMGAAAWGYQKVKLSLLADDEEDRHASPL